MTQTLTLTESELNNLHMALLIADQVTRTQLLSTTDGEIRHNTTQNRFQGIQALLGKVVRELDAINADRI